MVSGSGPQMMLPTQLVPQAMLAEPTQRVLPGAWELRWAPVETVCTPDDAAARREQR